MSLIVWDFCGLQTQGTNMHGKDKVCFIKRDGCIACGLMSNFRNLGKNFKQIHSVVLQKTNTAKRYPLDCVCVIKLFDYWPKFYNLMIIENFIVLRYHQNKIQISR